MQIRIYRILSLFGLGLSITLLFIYRLKRQKERLARQFEALQREKQEQYERSFQYVEANNAKLNELGTCWDRNLDEAVQGMAQKRGDEILFSSMTLHK